MLEPGTEFLSALVCVKGKENRGTYIAHIFGQKVLESLADRVALCHDALPAVIARA